MTMNENLQNINMFNKLMNNMKTEAGKQALLEGFNYVMPEQLGFWLKDQDGNYYQLAVSYPEKNLFMTCLINSATNEILEFSSGDDSVDTIDDVCQDLIKQACLDFDLELVKTNKPKFN